MNGIEQLHKEVPINLSRRMQGGNFYENQKERKISNVSETLGLLNCLFKTFKLKCWG